MTNTTNVTSAYSSVDDLFSLNDWGYTINVKLRIEERTKIPSRYKVWKSVAKHVIFFGWAREQVYKLKPKTVDDLELPIQLALEQEMDWYQDNGDQYRFWELDPLLTVSFGIGTTIKIIIPQSGTGIRFRYWVRILSYWYLCT